MFNAIYLTLPLSVWTNHNQYIEKQLIVGNSDVSVLVFPATTILTLRASVHEECSKCGVNAVVFMRI